MPDVKISRKEATERTSAFLNDLAEQGWVVHVYYSRKKFRLEPLHAAETGTGRKSTPVQRLSS